MTDGDVALTHEPLGVLLPSFGSAQVDELAWNKLTY
jgi:hypothetical protein